MSANPIFAQTLKNTVYIGTYTKKEGHVNGQAKGILQMEQDPENGSLKIGKTVAKIPNPSFVKASPNGQYLYAVSELVEGEGRSGFVYSYKINPDKSLTEINKLPSGGYAPCHIAIDKTGKFVFVSNYVGGVVNVYKIEENGALALHKKIHLQNPQQAHAHSVSLSQDNRHAYICDLGNDKILMYNFNAQDGSMTPLEREAVQLPEGAGPRHLSFSKNQRFAYSINELNSSLSSFKVKENGVLQFMESISSLPADFSGNNSGAEIQVHPSGKFLFVSNRGHNSIGTFKINKKTGKLKPSKFTSSLGETPRNFSISPNGDFLYAANQDTNSISIFKINRENGNLTQEVIPIEVKTPVCIEFLP